MSNNSLEWKGIDSNYKKRNFKFFCFLHHIGNTRQLFRFFDRIKDQISAGFEIQIVGIDSESGHY